MLLLPESNDMKWLDKLFRRRRYRGQEMIDEGWRDDRLLNVERRVQELEQDERAFLRERLNQLSVDVITRHDRRRGDK